MPTSILLDATHVGTPRPTGVELYADTLLPLLTRRLQAEGIAVTWIGHTPDAPASLPEGTAWRHSAYQPLWGQHRLVKELQEMNPALFFTPSGLIPVRSAVPGVMTVHDLAVYDFPEAFSRGQRFRLTTVSKRAAQKAASLITPSMYTKEEITARWDIDPTKIAVVPLAPFDQAENSRAVPGIDPEKPIILFVGRLETKKNILVLVEAFSKLGNADAQLVLAGPDAYGAEAIYAARDQQPESIRTRILFTGYIDASQKRWLYEHATVSAVPCKVEGFGLPVLESFIFKVPVLAAQAGALPEVGGAAALYADPENAVDWRAKLDQLLQSQELRQRYAASGQQRVREFSWEKTANQTATLLLTALQEHE